MKAPDKLARRMRQRGWTQGQIDEAVAQGEAHAAVNVKTGGSATRYVHPKTRRSVVVDEASGEVIHVGGDGFLY